ncbi:hypothetical protein Tco_0621859 [Tanacetum coccineum]
MKSFRINAIPHSDVQHYELFFVSQLAVLFLCFFDIDFIRPPRLGFDDLRLIVVDGLDGTERGYQGRCLGEVVLKRLWNVTIWLQERLNTHKEQAAEDSKKVSSFSTSNLLPRVDNNSVAAS